jgi:hypothetical protein
LSLAHSELLRDDLLAQLSHQGPGLKHIKKKKKNTISAHHSISIHYIDMITRLHEQRALLEAVCYIELAILGDKALLAASEGLGAPKEFKHFV